VPWLRYYNKDTARALNADSGYFNSEESLACDEADITVILPKPLTSGSKAKGRFLLRR
jgi:hypothetical protein